LEQTLERLAYERARAVAPVVLAGIVIALVASVPLGVPVPAPVFAWNLFIIPTLAALAILLARGRIPMRRGHAALAAVWISPVIGTLMSIAFTPDPVMTYLFTIELAAGALLLRKRDLVATFVVADIVWYETAALGTHRSLFAVFVIASEVIGLLFNHVFRTQIVTAETHRQFQKQTAEQLTNQLEELQRGEIQRAELQAQLVHAQRMDAVGTLSAGLAHDMNNILGSIVSFAELAREHPQLAPTVREDIDCIVTQAQRGSDLTRSLLAFSRRGQYRRAPVDVNRLIEGVIAVLGRTLPKTVEISSVVADRTVYVEGDSAQLGQVLINLGMNASDAMCGTGELRITMSVTDEVRIVVSDTGAGMDMATQLRAFEPFFTTKPLGKGTGLGLATAWGIVTGHDGRIELTSIVGTGTIFSITLPRCGAPVAAVEPPRREEPSPPNRQTVLVVDDEPPVRTGTRRILERAGYKVIEASNGADALSIFDAHCTAIGLVVLDMSMPVMGGAECFMRLREKTDVPVLVTTGHTTDEAAQHMMARGAAFLEKPFRAKQLSHEAKRLLDDDR
jgi:signal transduction histidine kinase